MFFDKLDKINSYNKQQKSVPLTTPSKINQKRGKGHIKMRRSLASLSLGAIDGIEGENA